MEFPLYSLSISKAPVNSLSISIGYIILQQSHLEFSRLSGRVLALLTFPGQLWSHLLALSSGSGVLVWHCALHHRDHLFAHAYDSGDLPTWSSGGTLVPTRAQGTLLSLLLFYARRVLILYWKKPMTPSLSYWKGLMNKVIPFYKATYLSKGCPKK